MVTANELAAELRKVMRFRFLTVDRHSVKLWSERPRFILGSRTWLGDAATWCGALSFESVELIAPLDHSKAIVEVM